MKKHSPLLAALLMTAATVAAMPAAAETTVSTGYETATYSFGGTDSTYEGLTTTISGEYASGLHYDLELNAGDIEGVSAKGGELHMGYLYKGIVGPAVSHEVSVIGGEHSARTLAGVEAAYALGEAIDLDGSVTSDVDAFGDDWAVKLGADYAFGNGFVATGSWEHERIAGAKADVLEAGVRYDLGNNAFVDGAVSYGEADGVDATSIKAGLGFSF